MIYSIHCSTQEEFDAIKSLLDSIAEKHGFVSPKSGTPSRSEAARAVLGAHPEIGFLLFSNADMATISATDNNGRVTTYMPDSEENRAKIELMGEGTKTSQNGWLSYIANE